MTLGSETDEPRLVRKVDSEAVKSVTPSESDSTRIMVDWTSGAGEVPSGHKSEVKLELSIVAQEPSIGLCVVSENKFDNSTRHGLALKNSVGMVHEAFASPSK